MMNDDDGREFQTAAPQTARLCDP